MAIVRSKLHTAIECLRYRCNEAVPIAGPEPIRGAFTSPTLVSHPIFTDTIIVTHRRSDRTRGLVRRRTNDVLLSVPSRS
jgi:hypothetical protein